MYILKLLFCKKMSINSDVVLDIYGVVLQTKKKKGMLFYDIDPEALIREPGSFSVTNAPGISPSILSPA